MFVWSNNLFIHSQRVYGNKACWCSYTHALLRPAQASVKKPKLFPKANSIISMLLVDVWKKIQEQGRNELNLFLQGISRDIEASKYQLHFNCIFAVNQNSDSIDRTAWTDLGVWLSVSSFWQPIPWELVSRQFICSVIFNQIWLTQCTACY